MSEKMNRPNILFLFSDQHSPHVLRHEGNELIRTPNLDRFAGEGMRFTQAYCQNPLCTPSRASLLTGRYCRNIGIYDNKHILESNSPTIPRILGANGYRTCLIGKAHYNGEQFHGYQQRPYGDLYGQAHQPDPRRHANESGLGDDVVRESGPSRIPLPMTQTEICVAESVKWLQAHVGLYPQQPFLLSVHFDKPHFPLRPPQQYFDYYAGKVSLPSFPVNHWEHITPYARKEMERNGTGLNSRGDQLRALAAYYGCVEWVDDAIGRLLDSLDYLGLSENTIVVYTSDHGEMGGEHGTWQKSLFYEASARVPFIIRWPGQVPAGSACDHPVGLIDLFPTFCEAAGCEAPETCDGQSLLPLLKESGTLQRDAIFSETCMLYHPDQAGCMIRVGKWKYCYYLDGNDELYNLDEDPGELYNLASDESCKNVVKSLRHRVIEFWEPEEHLKRYHETPQMKREKHFYEFSNQFVMGDGTVVDGRP